MKEQILIPNNAVKFILFQRTAFLRVTHNPFYKVLNKLLPFSIYNPSVAMEARLRAEEIKALYSNDIRKEYLSIQNFLPKKCSSVLDIGCGVAGIDIFLNNHYPGDGIEFYLFDKSYIEKKVSYSYRQKGAFYNSLDIAKAVLTENGIPESAIHLIEANDGNSFETGGKGVDLVISLISWGFHYPVETYLNRVYEVLNKGGSVIMDIRKDTNGVDVLKQKFATVEAIVEEAKYYRVLARK